MCELLLDVPAFRPWFPSSEELHMTIYGNCLFLLVAIIRMNILTGAAYLKEEELKGFDSYKVSLLLLTSCVVVSIHVNMVVLLLLERITTDVTCLFV